MNSLYGLAIDIGTSGIRVQALDLDTKEVVGTAITLRHPLPGANVIDHLHFAVEVGEEVAHKLIIDTINSLLRLLEIDLSKVERVAVDGNPTQLSLFQNIEVRDLAYWGEHAMHDFNITPPERNACVIKAGSVGLEVNPEADVYVPPGVKHEIGADALAMLVKSGVLEKRGISLVTDFGTNAEIALVIDGEVYTCSAAAGPAIEGQRIEKGMLASPGAICDVNQESNGWRTTVLNEQLLADKGDLILPHSGEVVDNGPMSGKALGITGTGVIAVLAVGMNTGLIKLPNIATQDRKLYLQDGIYFTRRDLVEAGKAIGAFRAGHISLCEEAGISMMDIDTSYMAGASGFYVDANKSMDVGQIPACSRRVMQIGNTSLGMAKDIVLNPEMLDKLQSMADSIRGKHIMLATSKVFEKVYTLELSYWEEGMPITIYNEYLRRYGFEPLPKRSSSVEIKRIFMRDIPELGKKGLKVLREIGVTLVGDFDECTGCGNCMAECPEKAITVEPVGDKFRIVIKSELCNGMACLRCQQVCPNQAFKFSELLKGKAI
ncbi:MAG: methylamine methyltransferase corrinoid protein reductive activase [Candidatus Verstraetearchaeota archaeon]|nr:methylamine methyltransferase corrinoid protein reductive activase [Candidatus Verstraetearchaeota archaeon]